MTCTTPPHQRLLTLQETAATMRFCVRTVRRMIDRGELKAVRLGRSIRIKDEELELYLLRLSK
jgi:excisionase family DNA binding protein